MHDEVVREHLLSLLQGRGAHLDFEEDFEEGMANLPPELRGSKVSDVPHTPWRLVEHMRIAQWDILEFCKNPNHVSPTFPDGYWPESDAPHEPELTSHPAAPQSAGLDDALGELCRESKETVHTQLRLIRDELGQTSVLSSQSSALGPQLSAPA